MKSFRKELWFNTPTRLGFVNITAQVDACLRESGVKEGMGASATSRREVANERVAQGKT